MTEILYPTRREFVRVVERREYVSGAGWAVPCGEKGELSGGPHEGRLGVCLLWWSGEWDCIKLYGSEALDLCDQKGRFEDGVGQLFEEGCIWQGISGERGCRWANVGTQLIQVVQNIRAPRVDM